MYKKNILLVDDLPLFLELEKEFFRREPAILWTAKSGREAVKLVREKKPDLVFMDLYMGDGNGDEACREIKQDVVLKSTPVVMVTSSTTPKDIERCQQAGCDAMIQKPPTRDQFLGTAKKFLDLTSGQRFKLRGPVRFGQDETKDQSGQMADISLGGLFLETDRLMPVDSQLHLEFRLENGSAPMRCTGRVAWQNPEAAKKKPDLGGGMGIEFLDLRKLDLLSLKMWIGRLKDSPQTLSG